MFLEGSLLEYWIVPLSTKNTITVTNCSSIETITQDGEDGCWVKTQTWYWLKRYMLQIVLSLMLLHRLIALVAVGWWIINVERDTFLLKLSWEADWK